MIMFTLFLVVLLIFNVSRNNLSGHVYIFHVVLMIFKVGRNNLRVHVYIFLVVLLIFKVSRNNLSCQVRKGSGASSCWVLS